MPDFPKKILLIEDEVLIQKKVAALIAVDYPDTHVLFCSSQAEVEELLRDDAPDLDLVLLDMILGDDNGPDVLNLLIKDPKTSDTPVVFFTGETDVKMLDTYKSLGVIGVIHKPFTATSLMESLKNIWAGQ